MQEFLKNEYMRIEEMRSDMKKENWRKTAGEILAGGLEEKVL